MKLLVNAVFAVALLTTMVIAQDGPRGHEHGFYGHGPGMGFHGLDLTDAQKSQMKEIFTAEKPTIKPLMKQEMQSHQQMTALVRSGSFDEAKAQLIAAQEAQIHTKIAVEHARIESQIYQLLSADQKTKLAEREAKHQQWMQQHEKDQAAPPDAPTE